MGSDGDASWNSARGVFPWPFCGKRVAFFREVSDKHCQPCLGGHVVQLGQQTLCTITSDALSLLLECVN